MVSNNCPRRVWDFGIKHDTKVIHMISTAKINDRTSIEAVTEETPNISDYIDFDFYDLVWYHTGKHPVVSKYHQSLGKWMGVVQRVGREMSYWIMPISSQPILEKTVQHITRDDMLNPDTAVQIKKFHQALTERLDYHYFIIDDFDGFGFEG